MRHHVQSFSNSGVDLNHSVSGAGTAIDLLVSDQRTDNDEDNIQVSLFEKL